MNRFLCLLFLAASSLHPASAEPISAQHKQGSMHGFLLVKSPQGKVIAVGEVVQLAEGVRLHSRLVFHFRDGSLDDETTVLLQRETLTLLRDHHVQKGPEFPTPLDVTINVPAGEVTWLDTKDGKIEINKRHMELPSDLANGIIPLVMDNVRPNVAETKVSYLASAPKPRVVKLSIKPEERESFTVGDLPFFATRYVMHIELGGFAGIIAPMVGKQPLDIHHWVTTGEVPSYVRMQGPFYMGGPVWTVELASPLWSHDGKLDRR